MLNINSIEYTHASASDEAAIKKILEECNLHSENIQTEMLKHFILAKNNNSIIGTIGMEIYDELGLLRSFCVKPSFRGCAVGKNLLDRFVSYSCSLGIKEIFLLTTTAENYFANHGFENVNREIVPEQIRKTAEFQNICPDSAVCMHMKIHK